MIIYAFICYIYIFFFFFYTNIIPTRIDRSYCCCTRTDTIIKYSFSFLGVGVYEIFKQCNGFLGWVYSFNVITIPFPPIVSYYTFWVSFLGVISFCNLELPHTYFPLNFCFLFLFCL